jgi:hypothetical protein
MLYTWFNVQEKTLGLDQLLYGYMDPSRRPQELTVFADKEGVIYLPNLGYYRTELSGENVVLHTSPDGLHFFQGDSEIKADFTPLSFLDKPSMELCLHNNPLLNNLFVKNDPPLIEESVGKHAEHLKKALDLIRMHYPEFYDLLQTSVKKLVLFKSEHRRSFATIQSNGTAFFSVHDEDDEVNFCEDITHQCGHVIYYSVLFDKASYFSVPIATDMKKYSGRDSDTRNVLGAFYSLLPFCFSNMNSLRLLKAGVFSGYQLHEFMGRFAFRMQKFSKAVKDFGNGEMLSDKGRELLAVYGETFREIDAEAGPLLAAYDCSNQLYDFSMSSFLALNPFIHA